MKTCVAQHAAASRPRRWGRGALVVALLHAAASSAAAAGLEATDMTPIALGRGGAVVADPGDGMAMQYNPAALAGQDGLRVTLDGLAARQTVRFEGTAEGLSGAAGQSGPRLFISPSGGAVSWSGGYLLGLRRVALAAGVTSPAGVGRLAYPADGPQRYALVESSTFLAYYGVAAAAEVLPGVRLGLTAQLARGTLAFSQQVRPIDGTLHAADVFSKVEADIGFAPTGVAGITVQPTSALVLAAAYRPRIRLRAGGRLAEVAPPVLQGLDVEQHGDAVQVRLAFPDVVRLGANLALTERLHVELDGVLEAWSVLDDITIHADNIVLSSLLSTQPLPDVVLPKHFVDSYSLRLGAELTPWDAPVILRAGYLVESSAIPSRSVSVDFPNFLRHVVGVGASLGLPLGIAVDVAYAHHVVPDQVITDSAVRQVVAPSFIPGQPAATPRVVGNGTYRVQLDVVSVGLRYVMR